MLYGITHLPPHVNDRTASSVNRVKNTLFLSHRIFSSAWSSAAGSFGITVVENTSMSRKSPELCCSSGIDGCMTLMIRTLNGWPGTANVLWYTNSLSGRFDGHVGGSRR